MDHRAGLLFMLAAAVHVHAAQPLIVTDVFGRDVGARGVTLLDWEGFMANPAVRLNLHLPEGVAYPATVLVQGDSQRLVFDRATLDDRYGVGKRVVVTEALPSIPFAVSIFPDRDGKDEDCHIVVTVLDAQRKEIASLLVPVHVVDQDKALKPEHRVVLDFSEDRTGFTKNPQVQRILRQAADDWSYFISDMGLDKVAAGDEKSEIWGIDGFVNTRTITNKKPYSGFLLYVTGIAGKELRSGGAASWVGKPQATKGVALPLWRSGSVEIETRGNYHRLGWFFSGGDQDWWCSGSQRDEPADFYSIMLHEMGHAIGFHGRYPKAEAAHVANRWVDPVVRAYLGADPAYDTSDHFAGSVDPASLFGVFGAEYQAKMKVRRWLITKAHLLLLQSVGYRLRQVSCFDRLAATYGSSGPAVAQVGQPFRLIPKTHGGIPSYRWEVVGGELPQGLSLDGFTGEIVGRPLKSGEADLTIRVTDQSPTPDHLDLRLALRCRL